MNNSLRRYKGLSHVLNLVRERSRFINRTLVITFSALGCGLYRFYRALLAWNELKLLEGRYCVKLDQSKCLADYLVNKFERHYVLTRRARLAHQYYVKRVMYRFVVLTNTDWLQSRNCVHVGFNFVFLSVTQRQPKQYNW